MRNNRIPLLPKYAALEVFESLRNGTGLYWDGKKPIPSFRHEAQRSFGSAQGDYSVQALQELRASILEDLDGHLESAEDYRIVSSAGDFDRRLSLSLNEHLQLTAIESSNGDSWAFLALLVLPEIPWLRYGKRFSEARFLGGQRNVFRVAWERGGVLGDLLSCGTKPLSEDELVGLFERSRMARNERLIRRLAVHILESKISNRSEYVRKLNVEVVMETGTSLLDALTDDELDGVIFRAGDRAKQRM